MKVALQLQQQYRAIECSWQGVLDRRDQGHEAFVAGLHTSFSQR